MAKVRDMASMLSDHLLLFLENCSERCIEYIEKVNTLKVYSIEIHVDHQILAYVKKIQWLPMPK